MRKTMRWLVMGALLGAFSWSGCSSGVGDDDGWWLDEPRPADPYGGVTESLLVDASLHQGSLGPVQDFEGGIYMTEGYDYGTFSELAVYSHDTDASESGSWAAMSRLMIDGGLDHPDLVPGTTLTFSDVPSWDPDAWNSSTLHVSLVGCSGPEDGFWEYDVPADEVVITVLPGDTENERTMHFEGTFEDGSVVEGDLHYELR